MRARRNRRLRQIVQIASFGLFLFLFISTSAFDSRRVWADLFFRFDPLVALTAMLAGRAWIASLSLAALTLVVTVVFGRVWCGWVCPMGTLLEWFSPKGRAHHVYARRPSEKWRMIKYVLLFILMAAALFGSQALLFLDPITLISRSMATALWPAFSRAVMISETFLYRFEVLWPVLDVIDAHVIRPVFKGMVSVFTLGAPIALFFAGIVALNWVAERFWCRYLCPLGALLGIFSKFALFRRVVEEHGCALCGRCNAECPTGTIDPERGFRSDPAECIVCYDCMVDCTREGVRFRWQLPAYRPAEWRPYDPKRRELLVGLVSGAAVASLATIEPVTQRQPAYMIRPPGATLTDFESLCVRCGECMRVCPTQGLQPSLFVGGMQNVMTPRLAPRLGYCSYSCVACGEVCPTGAIPQLTLGEKQHVPIGLARIDRSRCLPWAHNIPCIVCEEVCPVRHKAIWLTTVQTRNAQGEIIDLQLPSVVKELCIGCGLCEYHCPMGGEAAVRVFAPTEAGAYLGDDPAYRPRRHQGYGGGEG
ncbi:MAG: 4Fe-4S binding protein [Anaerolineae bacterium]|nr:4Fe-4S binding protein [Anaerolineae bacterium]